MKYAALAIALLCISCKSGFIQKSPITGVEITDWQASKGGITFKITNASEYDLFVESTWKLHIEKFQNDDWVKVPYIPCQCETPCREPIARQLRSGEDLQIDWDYISRKCTSGADMSPNTIVERVEKGEYRFTFVLNPSKDGTRINPEKLEVYFKAE